MASLNNITYASPNNSFYALAGQSASNWFNFSSLTGKIFLTDDTGNHVIQAIGNDLYYDNELLAKAADIQNIADWSLYPALSTILMNGNIITECSSIQVSSITTTNVATTTVAATGVVLGGTLATVPGPYTPGDVKTTTVSATSVSASANVSGGSLTTTGGLDMTNTGLLRTSNIALSAFGAAPYGNLTSPDGASLTWNGSIVNTGAAGSASQWANYPAVSNVNMNGSNLSNALNVSAFAFQGTNVEATNIAAGTTGSGKFMVLTNNSITGSSTDGITVSLPSGNLTTTVATGNMSNTATGITNAVSNNFEITADAGINPLVTPNINLTAKNGNGGQVNLVADPGSVVALGGAINITANGGTVYVPQTPPAPPLAVTVGGEVNITANTGAGGLYTLTSAINLVAAGINSYAGAIPPVGSLAGYQFIYGTGGVSLCAGLPASGLQFPGTTYIYGVGVPGVAGGVRLQSPQGIQMLSDTYIENLYPLDGNGLTIQGRSLPTGYVTIKDCDNLTMTTSGTIKTDKLNSVSGLGLFYLDNLVPFPGSNLGVQAYTIKPPIATVPGGSNLLISGNPFLLNNNYVAIQNLSTLSFDPTAAGSITGLQSINGAAWPPPTGDASLWSQYPATSVVNISSFGLTNVSSLTGVSSINGIPYAANDTALWASYPASQTVNMSTYGLVNVNDVSFISTATIIGTGALNADVAGDLSFFTSGGGEINLSTRNLASINLTALGPGNDVNVSGDTVALNAIQGVNVSAPALNLLSNGIINVSTLSGVGGTTPFRIQNTGTGGTDLLDLNGGILIASQVAPVTINGGSRLQLNTNTGNINLLPQGGASTIQLLGDSFVGTVPVPKNLTVNGTITGTGTITGGAISGSTLSASGAVSGASLSVSGSISGSAITGAAITGTSIGTTGAITGASVTATGMIMGGTVAATGAVSGGSLTTTGTMKSASITDAALSVGTANQVLTAGAAGSSLAWTSANSLSYIYADTIFVDPNGSDTTGNGGISNPYQTLTKAITVRNGLPDTTEISIFVASGTYNESPTITKSNTFLCGFNSSGANKSSVNLVGTISVAITSTTSGTTQVVFSDFQINGLITFLNTNVSQPTQYSFENINFTGFGTMLSILNASGNYDATKVSVVNNCVFNHLGTGNSAMVLAQRTTMTITNSQFYASITAPCLNMNYAAICYARFSSFINTSSNTATNALVQFSGSYTATTVFPSFENCIFRYLSSAVDVGGNKCCIQFGGSSAYESQIYNNTLYCEGAITGTPLIQAVQKTGTGAVTVKQFGNDCGLTAFHIAPAITQIVGTALT